MNMGNEANLLEFIKGFKQEAGQSQLIEQQQDYTNINASMSMTEQYNLYIPLLTLQGSDIQILKDLKEISLLKVLDYTIQHFMFPRSGQDLQASLTITFWRSNISIISYYCFVKIQGRKLYMHDDVHLFPSGSMHGYLVLKVPLLYRQNTIEKWFQIIKLQGHKIKPIDMFLFI